VGLTEAQLAAITGDYIAARAARERHKTKGKEYHFSCGAENAIARIINELDAFDRASILTTTHRIETKHTATGKE
jgi:hypothetical protein